MENNTNRIRVVISAIDGADRIRTDYSHVDELAESMREHGLLQPIVITLDNKLVAGGSRLRAAQQLGWTEIDVTYVETIPEDKLRILEVEENVRRKSFSWQERVVAVARIHNLQWRASVVNPEASKWTQRQTGELLNVSVGHVNSCLLLSKLIETGDKEILAADSPTTAIKLLLERKEIEANRALAAATLRPQTRPAAVAKAQEVIDLSDILSSLPVGDAKFVGGAGIGLPTLPALVPGSEPGSRHTVSAVDGSTLAALTSLSAGVDAGAPGAVAPNQPPESLDLSPTLNHICRLGDCIELMSRCEPVDHIITDIPYGIDMGMLQQQNQGINVSSTANEHTIEGNISLMEQFIPAAYRTIKESGGYCVLFYDLAHHARLEDLARTAGFKVQRWPLVWVKTSACINQAAQYNFTKATEFAMVLRKGNATLTGQQPNNFWMGARDNDPRTSTHPFAKPLALWKWVMNAVAIKGQTILDPFAGVGSSTLAALEAGFSPIACELNPAFHATLVSNINDFYLKALCPSPVKS